MIGVLGALQSVSCQGNVYWSDIKYALTDRAHIAKGQEWLGYANMQHTTILHGCRQIAKLKDVIPELNHDVNVLLQVLRG